LVVSYMNWILESVISPECIQKIIENKVPWLLSLS